ncbi:MAG: PqqD family protein [Acidobacteriota bacterium]|nr:PqqD family protein [Acidobacteriota bacterium]
MKPKARRDNLKVKQDTGELFIEDVLNAKYIHLNPTSAYVWEKCDGNHEPVEIALEMGKELGVTVSESVVYMTIEKLSREKLLI